LQARLGVVPEGPSAIALATLASGPAAAAGAAAACAGVGDLEEVVGVGLDDVDLRSTARGGRRQVTQAENLSRMWSAATARSAAFVTRERKLLVRPALRGLIDWLSRAAQAGVTNSTLWAVSTISSMARVPPTALSVGPDHRLNRTASSTQEQTSARRSSNRRTVTVLSSALPRMTLRSQDQISASPLMPRRSVTSVTRLVTDSPSSA
jgi:hypothetical protein